MLTEFYNRNKNRRFKAKKKKKTRELQQKNYITIKWLYQYAK